MSALLARGFGLLLSLISVPITLSYLGREQYGLLAVVTSLISWTSLFDLGLVNGLVNKLAEAYGRDDKESASRYFATAFFLLLVTASIAGFLFIGLLVSVNWAQVLGVKKGLPDSTLRWTVGVAFYSFLATMPFTVVRQAYVAYQRGYAAHLLATASSAVGLAMVLAAIHLKQGLPAIAASSGLATVIVGLFGMLRLLRRDMPWLTARFSRFSKVAAKRLLDVSVPLFLFQVSSLVINQTQPIILAYVSSLSAVAEYTIAMKLYLVLASLITMATASFIPAFREAFESGDLQWLRHAFRRLVALRVSGAAIAFGVLAVAGNALLDVWLGQETMSFTLAVWLALGVLMVAAQWVSCYTDLLTILDRIWPQVILVTVNGGVTVGLTLALAPRWGMLGAIVASGVVTVALWTWLLPLLTKRLVGGLLGGPCSASSGG